MFAAFVRNKLYKNLQSEMEIGNHK